MFTIYAHILSKPVVSFSDQLCSLLCAFKYMGEMKLGGVIIGECRVF